MEEKYCTNCKAEFMMQKSFNFCGYCKTNTLVKKSTKDQFKTSSNKKEPSKGSADKLLKEILDSVEKSSADIMEKRGVKPKFGFDDLGNFRKIDMDKKCNKCKEESPPQFDICWKCGSSF